MFIVNLTYLCNLEILDQHLAEHRQFLDKHYGLGHFLASGPQVPRTGGVILANVENREKLEAILAEDPFQIHGVASYQVTEFLPIKTSAALAHLKVQ